jgi:hypothetical protein
MRRARLAEVHARTAWVNVRRRLQTSIGSVCPRKKVASTICGLFSAAGHQTILNVLGCSLIFLALTQPSGAEQGGIPFFCGLVPGEIYLLSCGQSLADDAPVVVRRQRGHELLRDDGLVSLKRPVRQLRLLRGAACLSQVQATHRRRQ